MNERRDDVQISFFGAKISGPVKAIISLLTGTFSVLVLVGLMAYHLIEDIRSNANIISAIREVNASVNLQNAILIVPQDQRGMLAHRLPAETQKNLGMVEVR